MPRHFFARLFVALALLVRAGIATSAEITVSAAASLTDAFKDIAQAYEAHHPGDKVLLNFGASGALLQQIAKGAPVDVFATADEQTMDAAASQRLIAPGQRRNFARNTLVVVVPSDSRLVLHHVSDLRQPAVRRIAVGNPASVPVGRYTRAALESARLWAPLGQQLVMAQNVRQALDYVARGEVDAGFVYGTDAAVAKDRVKAVLEVPLAVPISYPIAVTTAGANKPEARGFLAYVLSPEAQAILARYGFHTP